MLEHKYLQKFIDEVYLGYTSFCIWKQMNIQYASTKPNYTFLNKISDNLELAEYTRHHIIHQIIGSLKNTFLLTAARLCDPPRHVTKKEIAENISTKLILEKIDDPTLTKWMNSRLNEQKNYIDNLIEWRRKFLAHNDSKFKQKYVKAGTELFYATMHEFIVKIKQDHDPTVVWDENTLINIEKEVKIGVNNFFVIPDLVGDPDLNK
jgi:hypothetical protein